MGSSRLSGLWSQEISQIKSIKTTLDLFRSDIASNDVCPTKPSTFIQTLESKLNTIADKIENNQTRSSFFNTRIPKLELDIISLNKELNILKIECLISENKAETISKKIASSMEKLSESYQLESFQSPPQAHQNSKRLIRNMGFRVWCHAQSQLEYFRQIENFDRRRHNSLAHLLLSDDTLFAQSLADDRAPMEGEIGVLAIQRLQRIFSNPESNLHVKKDAVKAMRKAMTSNTPDKLLSYDENTLTLEITRLILHARLNPENKVVWLGTARAVNAMIEHAKPIGIYLNPEPSQLTWALNRFWLKTAAQLGYEIKLVEQHFPKIETALLSQDPAKFLEQLLLETRENSTDKTSQYNGNYSPTATPQEVIALMDMGCVAYKAPDKSIAFSLPPMRYEESLWLSSRNTRLEKKVPTSIKFLGRNHTFDGVPASNPPPFQDRSEHFRSPKAAQKLSPR
ncbi:MAG: hypothetical protein NXI01_07215 [Gammaproteobacteria bacterium]|nr:hypothetical protein [Gammaproteobacteria bacterium]